MVYYRRCAKKTSSHAVCLRLLLANTTENDIINELEVYPVSLKYSHHFKMMLDGRKGVQVRDWKSIPITLPLLFITGPPIAGYK
jgi:hypothetical protein